MAATVAEVRVYLGLDPATTVDEEALAAAVAAANDLVTTFRPDLTEADPWAPRAQQAAIVEAARLYGRRGSVQGVAAFADIGVSSASPVGPGGAVPARARRIPDARWWRELRPRPGAGREDPGGRCARNRRPTVGHSAVCARHPPGSYLRPWLRVHRRLAADGAGARTGQRRRLQEAGRAGGGGRRRASTSAP